MCGSAPAWYRMTSQSRMVSIWRRSLPGIELASPGSKWAPPRTVMGDPVNLQARDDVVGAVAIVVVEVEDSDPVCFAGGLQGQRGNHQAVEGAEASPMRMEGKPAKESIESALVKAAGALPWGAQEFDFPDPILARISHQISTAAADPGMSTALRSVGLLDVLSSTPAAPSVARLVSMPACAASLRNLVRNAG